MKRGFARRLVVVLLIFLCCSAEMCPGIIDVTPLKDKVYTLSDLEGKVSCTREEEHLAIVYYSPKELSVQCCATERNECDTKATVRCTLLGEWKKAANNGWVCEGDN